MKSLRLEPTIPGGWEEWCNYHVLHSGEFETMTIKTKHDRLDIHYGLQDGIPVGGESYKYAAYEGDGPGSGGCNPGRKWGEYRSIDDVITQHLIDNRKHFKRKDILALIDQALATRPGKQLTLFK